ncbi:hypothetical protein H5410_041656 [Solanum commersonii]|uniref:Uncharacterized protein n=1 Tax=Solanum commersonii TaxID=4109 RepID=A0A9J5XW56_SOLCO|nr:hypothetical protein H5410_041656 [Solanum commersonii]
MLEWPKNDGNFLISRIIQLSCSYTQFLIPPNLTAVLPASSSIRPNNKHVSIQIIVRKIVAIPLFAICSMDISPSNSDGSWMNLCQLLTQ